MTPVGPHRSWKFIRISAGVCIVCLAVFLAVSFWWYEASLDLRRKAESQNQTTFNFPIGFTAVSGPTAVPQCGQPPQTPAIPSSMTSGDVILITLAFGCTTDGLSPKLRNDGFEMAPELHAPGFEIDPVVTTAFVDKDFYCSTALSDQACNDGSTTKPQDLKWTWSLRPQSPGQHLLVFVVNQRRIGTKSGPTVGAPRFYYISSMDVHDSLSAQATALTALFAAVSGLATVVGIGYRASLFVRNAAQSAQTRPDSVALGSASPT